MKEFDNKESSQDVLVTKALEELPIYFYHPDHASLRRVRNEREEDTTNALIAANGMMYQFFLNLLPCWCERN